VLKLFDNYNNHISGKILLVYRTRRHYIVDLEKLSLFSGLHCASIFGIDEIVSSLIDVEGCDINQVDCAGNTPLVWAAWSGHEGVLKILLGRDDVNPDKPGFLEQTPLFWAARRGYEGVVKILLKRDDVNSNKPDNQGQTPLSRAIQSGHTGVVALLQPLASTTPNPTPEQQATVPLTPSDYRYNSPRATSTRTTPTPQTRPLRPSPPSYSSRTTSSRISKRRPR